MRSTTKTTGKRTASRSTGATNFDPKVYGRLLSKTVPSVITDAAEYDRIESIFARLIDKGEEKLSPEETRLFGLLASLLEEYENRTLPVLPNVSPPDALRFLMQENDLLQKDLVDVFGSQAVVSKVLSGKRSVSKGQAKRLAEKFAVGVEAFI